MYAINRSANIIKEKDIKNKTIYILSDSKSSLQALEKDETCTNIIKETKSNLNLISEKNNVYLIKIPAHTNIFGNELADKHGQTCKRRGTYDKRKNSTKKWLQNNYK